MTPIRPVSTSYLHELMYRQTLLVKSMKAKWEELGIEALIMPNYPVPAFKD